MKQALLIVSATLLLQACVTQREQEEIDIEKELTVELAAVPAGVIAAATKALPGINLTDAEYEEEDGLMVYELEGTLGEARYEIEVTPEGEVLEVEQIED
jgi:uncharacterized membrane protein YkoI